MRKIFAAACCILWLLYGSLSGLAHVHADFPADQIHGLGLDHAHDSHGPEPAEHGNAYGFYAGGSSLGGHHDGPFYLTANALNPGPRIMVARIDPAGEALAAPQVRAEAVHLDNNRRPPVLHSKEPPGLRAPPA